MMKEPSKQRLTGIFPLLLFMVLAACVLTVLLTGADLYRGLIGRDRESYVDRTAAQYVTVKVRQASGEVSVGEFGGSPALILQETLDGEEYLTRIYCRDGWLRELFSAADSDMAPEDGEKLLELREADFSESEGLLTVVLDGQTIFLQLRGEEAP